MIFKKKTLKKNPSNLKPISYFTEEREGELKCKDIQTYRHTDRHTDPPTKRVLEEHSLLKNWVITLSRI